MKKNNFYKYGFWIIFVLSITSLNIFNKIGRREDLNNFEINNHNRTQSLIKSERILGKTIKEIRIKNYETKKWMDLNFKEKTIIILLSKFGCQSCQIRELSELENLKNIVGLRNKLEIIPFVLRDEKDVAKVMKEKMELSGPIFICDSTTFFDFSFAKQYPQILYIVDGIVLSAFKPIPMDDEFSENYYKELIKIIKKTNNLPDEAKQLNIN